jgi:hypothetical protein
LKVSKVDTPKELRQVGIEKHSRFQAGEITGRTAGYILHFSDSLSNEITGRCPAHWHRSLSLR